jgi:hypothetical protein
MKYIKWAGVIAAVLLIIACFLPWYTIGWKNITITGTEAGDKLGKPAYWHFVFTIFFLLFTFIPRIWAKQWNVFIAAVNVAWMIRNFFALAVCNGGFCPERQSGIWMVLISSVVMLLSSLFPDFKIQQKKSL